MGAQPFSVALHMFCPLSITLYFPFPPSYTWSGWRPSESSSGINAQTSDFSLQTLSQREVENHWLGLHTSVSFGAGSCAFSVKRWLQEEGMRREGMHFSLCAAASLLWQPEKRHFLSLSRPSTPCSLLIIFGWGGKHNPSIFPIGEWPKQEESEALAVVPFVLFQLIATFLHVYSSFPLHTPVSLESY